MTVDSNIAIVRRFIDEVLNKGQLELIPELWASDLVWHGGSLGTVQGVEAYTRMLSGSAASFEDLHLIVDDIVATGDKVVVRFTNGGRNIGPFLGAEPTDEVIRWEGIGIYQVAESRIVEAWFSEDLLGFAGQVGLIDL
jgi:predicted ester cyclase